MNAMQFNAKHPKGSQFKWKGKQVTTATRAWDGGKTYVKLQGITKPVNIKELLL